MGLISEKDRFALASALLPHEIAAGRTLEDAAQAGRPWDEKHSDGQNA